ncbi:MAG: NAD-binding protein [Thermodesulfobacteriota bacterium]
MDFSPEVEQRLNVMNIASVYGDLGHMDTLKETHIENARIAVSTITDDFLRGTDNLRLLKQVKAAEP